METKLNQTLLLIVNPVSGKRLITANLTSVIRTFMDAGYLVTTAVTAERGEATALAAAYAGSFDRIVCAGGDGTLNETVTGLLQKNLSVPIGYLPCGSTNDFAASHGIPLELEEAAALAVSGRPQAYDVGLFGDRCFTYVAAFGAFSSISYSTDQSLKNMFGHAAYLMGGLWGLGQIKPIALTVRADGQRFEGDFVFGAVCNTLSIGGTLQLPDSLVDTADGKLELLLIRMPDDLIDLEEIISALFDQNYDSPLLEFVQAKEITVESAEPLEWSLDGEASGEYTSVTVTASPGFLQLIS